MREREELEQNRVLKSIPIEQTWSMTRQQQLRFERSELKREIKRLQRRLTLVEHLLEVEEPKSK